MDYKTPGSTIVSGTAAALDIKPYVQTKVKKKEGKE